MIACVAALTAFGGELRASEFSFGSSINDSVIISDTPEVKLMSASKWGISFDEIPIQLAVVSSPPSISIHENGSFVLPSAGPSSTQKFHVTVNDQDEEDVLSLRYHFDSRTTGETSGSSQGKSFGSPSRPRSSRSISVWAPATRSSLMSPMAI